VDVPAEEEGGVGGQRESGEKGLRIGMSEEVD
jgi:hypothetical protein